MKPTPIQLRLHPREKYLPSDRTYARLDTYPAYYKIGTYAYEGERYTSIIYEIYYQANGAIGLNGMLHKNESLGYHDKDVERIIVLYDPSTETPQHIFFSAHAQEGVWYPSNKCKFSDGKLVVYSSLNSHSNHPTPGTTMRIFGFANDYRSDKGEHLDLTLIEDETISYKAQNEEVINNALRRVLLPLFQKQIPILKKQQAAKELEDNKNV